MIYASTPATASANHKGPGVYLASGVGWGRDHQPNPVLIAYREHLAKWRLTTAASEWMFALDSYDAFGGYMHWEAPNSPYHALTKATPPQAHHARRVFERLTNQQNSPLGGAE